VLRRVAFGAVDGDDHSPVAAVFGLKVVELELALSLLVVASGKCAGL
jgi:hypothetical protein